MSVKLIKSATHVCVDSPYHPDFPTRAKKLGGKWEPASRRWCFDIRDVDRVAGMCRDIFGTDGESPETLETITVRLTCKGTSASASGIYFAGRSVCYATGRDSGAKLSEGVILLSGRVKSGGSMKNWTTEITAGTVLEIRDIPLAAVKANTDNDWDIVILPEHLDPKIALEAEKVRLLARLAEIETELAN